MKKLSLFFMAILAIGLSSCSDDDSSVSSPVISKFYMGDHDSERKAFKQGESICVEFDVEVEPDTRLDYYRFEIISKADNKTIVDDRYDNEILDLRNAHIHTHAMVEEDTPAGNYIFKITVGAKNNSVTIKEIEIVVEENPGIPHITNFKLYNKKDNSKDFVVGETVVIEFKATVEGDKKLASYHLEIHDHPKSGKLEDEVKVVDDTFTADFAGLTTATIKKEVVISNNWNGQKGNQSFHLVVTDNKNDAIEVVNTVVIK